MDSVGNEGYFLLNRRKILCGPEHAVADMIASTIGMLGNGQIVLECADADMCLLVLNKCIESNYVRWHILEKKKGSLDIFLDSCAVDERFFALIEQHWGKSSDVKVVFRGDSSVQLKKEASLSVLTRSLVSLGKLNLALDADSYDRKKQIYFEMSFSAPEKDENLGQFPDPSSVTLQVDSKSLPAFSIEETKDGKLASQAPLLMILLRLPTVVSVLIGPPATMDLRRQVFDELCKRPEDSLVCRYEDDTFMDSSLPHVLDYFHQAKITNLVLRMTPSKVLDKSLLEKALKVLVESAHMEDFCLLIDDQAQYESALGFLKELKANVQKMKPFVFYFDNRIEKHKASEEEQALVKDIEDQLNSARKKQKMDR